MTYFLPILEPSWKVQHRQRLPKSSFSLRDFSMQTEFPSSATPELLQLLNLCALKPPNFRTSNIGIREERFNDRFIGYRVEVQDGEYFSAAMVSAQRHVRNIYRVRSENGADLADNSRDVMLLQQEEHP